MEEIKIVVRKFLEDLDQAMIYSTWRNGAYFSSEKPISGSASKFFEKMSYKIRDIIPTADIKIACLEDSPQTIVGYCVSKEKHIEWIYVKPAYRLQGIAKMLAPKDIETVPEHLTKTGAKIVEMKKLKRRNDDGRNSEDRQENKSL